MARSYNTEEVKIVSSPKSTFVDAVIIDMEITNWREVIEDEKKLEKFKNPDTELVRIVYELQFDGRKLRGDETYNYYDPVPDNSKLGKFHLRYKDAKVGSIVKVKFNAHGIGEIDIE